MADIEPDFFKDPEVIQDPNSYFDLMRSKCPVAREQHQGTIMVTGYAEVMEVLNRKDDTFSPVVSLLGPIPPLPFKPEGDDSQFVTAGPEYGQWANGAHFAGFFGHQHNIANHTCDIEGDTAHCETYVIGTLLPRNMPGRAKYTSARYIDRFERRGGEWRIAVRRTIIEVEIEGEAKWPEHAMGESFPKGAWDTGDLSYARPLNLDTLSPHWDGTTR